MPKPGCILQPRLHYETRGDTACGGASEGDLATTKRGKEPPSANAGLAAEPAQAYRFLKARSARSASLLEDYTELIADLIAANGEARARAPSAGGRPADRRWRAARSGGGRRRGHRALRLRYDAQRLRGVSARPRRILAQT